MAVSRLKQDLSKLDWKPECTQIPIIITDGNYFENNVIPGFLTIPWDYKVEELHEYIAKNLSGIKTTRRQIQLDMIDIQYFMVQLTEYLELKSLTSVKTDVKTSILAILKDLDFNKELLRAKKYLAGLHLCIGGEKYHFDWERGKVFIASDFTIESFTEFLEKNQLLFEYYQKLFVREESFKQEVHFLMNSIKVVLGIENLLFDLSLLNKKSLQVAALVTLERHLPALKQFNLSGVSIVLGSQFSWDKINRRLYLPYTFTLQQFGEFLQQSFSLN